MGMEPASPCQGEARSPIRLQSERRHRSVGGEVSARSRAIPCGGGPVTRNRGHLSLRDLCGSRGRVGTSMSKTIAIPELDRGADQDGGPSDDRLRRVVHAALAIYLLPAF